LRFKIARSLVLGAGTRSLHKLRAGVMANWHTVTADLILH